MKRKIRRLIFVSLFIAISFHPACGGGGSDGGDDTPTTKTSEEFVSELVTLEGQLSSGAITEDEYFTDLIAIYDEIEATTSGLSSFETYCDATINGGGAAAICVDGSAELKATVSPSIMDRIEASPVYQFLKNFMETAIFTVVPEPISIPIQVAQPETFVSLSTGTGYAILQRALVNSEIDVLKYQELYEINRTNPYEAMRQLYIAKGQSIPDWLAPAPTNCLINCQGFDGTYTGTFNSTGNFSRAFDDTTCTWSFTFNGTATLSLTADQYANVSGSTVRMTGTAPWVYVSGSVSTRVCEAAGTLTIDSTASVTGYTTSMTWTSDMGSGIFPGVFTGSLTGNTVSGNMTVTYTNGSGSLLIPLSLTK